jgi:GNAT superfamily N-acetyltransferase
MKIIKITQGNNTELLERFISTIGTASNTFRYFNSRPVSIIQNHLATLILLNEEGTPIAYGHLDKDGDDVWLGICVLPEYAGKGNGKKMMAELFNEARKLNLSQIVLTVDKDNSEAIGLYEKLGFYRVEERATHYKYQYNIS